MPNCKTIAICNQKGGTGKTTTTVNLGVGLARLGKKVLLVDADPQGDLTTCLGWRDNDSLATTITDKLSGVIRDDLTDPQSGILHHEENVDLLPANIELSAMEMMLITAMSRETILRSYLSKVKDNYDYVLVDCMPSLGMVTLNALAAADSVIIPVQAQYLPAKGMTQLMQTIGKVRQYINPSLRIDGILLNIVDNRTNLAKSTADALRQNFGSVIKIYRSSIPMAVKAAEVASKGVSIYKYEPSSPVAKAYRIWSETADRRSAQLVFCDLSTPKSDGSFNVYDDIKTKLVARGIPAEEIKFIHEADTEAKKQELFKKVRRGEVRVLIGSTAKMGAGTNVQNKLIASHDLDCPWRPSDLEQRAGRTVRQGNENPVVGLYRYVTEETFDAYLYQLVEGKQKFASQIMTSKSPVRSADDIDETALSYAEIKMLATGNPFIKEKMDLDIQVQRLRLLKSSYLSEIYALEDKIIKHFPQQIAAKKELVAALESDLATAQKHPKPTDDRFVGIEVKGVFYSEKAEGGQKIIDACQQMSSPDPVRLGTYRGFDLELSFNTMERTYEVKIRGAASRIISLGTDPTGNITRIDNAVEKISERLEAIRAELDGLEKQFEVAKVEVKKPFAKEQELKEKTDRLNVLNGLLNVDKRDNELADDEPGEVEETTERTERKEKDLER